MWWQHLLVAAFASLGCGVTLLLTVLSTATVKLVAPPSYSSERLLPPAQWIVVDLLLRCGAVAAGSLVALHAALLALDMQDAVHAPMMIAAFAWIRALSDWNTQRTAHRRVGLQKKRREREDYDADEDEGADAAALLQPWWYHVALIVLAPAAALAGGSVLASE